MKAEASGTEWPSLLAANGDAQNDWLQKKTVFSRSLKSNTIVANITDDVMENFIENTAVEADTLATVTQVE